MESYQDSVYQRDFNMHEQKEGSPFGWESTLRVAVVGREEIFMEEREGRKRKWQEEGKMIREDSEEKVQRKVPPKKLMGVQQVSLNLSLTSARQRVPFAYSAEYTHALNDMGGSGGSSSSSHLSPGWQVNDLDLDLPPELSMNEALLSLPSLAVFKQEAVSPVGDAVSPARRLAKRPMDRQVTNMVLDDNRDAMECHQSHVMQHGGSPESMQCQPVMSAMIVNGYHSPSSLDNKNAGLLMCSPSSLEGFLQSPNMARGETNFRDDFRFQYVLAAATSIATKQNEETLTYLNQGQPYEVKLKKLGDLSHYKGKILKSVIKICFHERRLQYMEREQIFQWHADRPGERILEVDVPLSYGVVKVEQPTCLNALHVFWDPTKDVGVYIKVNCISTEFTAKKHGGEKGVPFRIQVETLLASDDRRLHAAAAQIKVFKLKGADRKHKQDREKVMRRPRGDLDKYQPGCEATVLTTLSNDAVMPPPSLVTATPPYSPEMSRQPPVNAPPKTASPVLANKPVLNQPAIQGSPNQMKPLYCQDGSEMKVSTACQSPGAILPDLPQAAEEPDKSIGLSKEATAHVTQQWLASQRFAHHANTFANFAGADLLRLSRDDMIQICGLADGIRLYNALHAKRIEPRLTLYVCSGDGAAYSAIYLHACRSAELLAKIRQLRQGTKDVDMDMDCDAVFVFVSGPGGARVRLTDEVVRHLPDHGTFRVQRTRDGLLLTATAHSNQQ